MGLKRNGILFGAAAVVVAVAGADAWLTRASNVLAESPPASPAPAPPVAIDLPKPQDPARSVVLPAPEPPPEPTAAEFQRDNPSPPPAASGSSTDWANLPIEELRNRANGEEAAAMAELARRLLQGVGVAKDQQAGAGWLLRAAEHGSPQAAFNVGVMYERGFVVERDPARAIEWYRKAVQANLPMAKYNLALMLRDGRGAIRDGQEAADLLRGASRQGMAAAMFALGDLYDRGAAVIRDPATALAWFAITSEFERQTNRAVESTIAKAAEQRVQTLRRTLLPGGLERAQEVGQSEFKQIVESLQPGKPAASEAAADSPAKPAAPEPAAKVPADLPAAATAPRPETPGDPAGWPKTPDEQIRAIQQGLVDLKLLRDKPDGVLGPMTRTAIKSLQKTAGIPETGDPTKDVYVALQEALAHRATETRSGALDLGQPDPPPPPPTSTDIERSAGKPD
jgi:hypothetical protein